MKISRHAERRCQQRAITQDDIRIILDYGTRYKCPGGATRFTLLEKDAENYIQFYRYIADRLQRLRGKAVVIADNGSVITVQKQFK